MKVNRVRIGAFLILVINGCLNPGDETLSKSDQESGIIFTHIPTTNISSGFSPDDANSNFRNEEGTNIYKLAPASPQGEITNLTEEWTMGKPTARHEYPGAAMDPELSHDNRFLLFSMKMGSDDRNSYNCFQIFELNLGTNELVQLTGYTDKNSGVKCDENLEGHNFSPAYMQNGDIIFTSTRNHIADEYERREAPQLYVGKRSGDPAQELETGFQSVMQVSFNQSFDQNPMVHSSGKIYFCRWEHLGDPNKMPIFTINPDGTGLFVLFGNHSPVGNAAFLYMQETREGRLVASMMKRGSRIAGGALALLDITKSDNAIEYITPGGSPYAGDNEEWLFLSPRPIMDAGVEKIVAAGAPAVTFNDKGDPIGNVNYGIYLIDPKGGHPRLIWDDPDGTEYDPIPIEPPDLKIKIVGNENYQSPFVPPELIDPANPTGYFFTTDVRLRSPNDGQPHSADVMNRATYIRLLEAVELPKDNSLRGGEIGNTNLEKQNVIGYGSVRDDYSFSIEVPANTSMHMQILDENAMMIVNQRTWVQVLPGERRVCVGCHNTHEADDAIFDHEIIDSDIDPLGIINKISAQDHEYESSFANSEKIWDHVGYRADTLDFADRLHPEMEFTVQKVFDNNCTQCHNASQADGGVNLAWNVANDPQESLMEPTHVYESLTGDNNMGMSDGSSWVTDKGASRSPFMWVMFHENLHPTSDEEYNLSAGFDHSTLWAKDSTSGGINPFLPENRDLLTLIEWIDAGTQYSNSTGYGGSYAEKSMLGNYR